MLKIKIPNSLSQRLNDEVSKLVPILDLVFRRNQISEDVYYQFSKGSIYGLTCLMQDYFFIEDLPLISKSVKQFSNQIYSELAILKERMFHEGCRGKVSGEGCPISDYFFLNEWGIDIYYVPFSNEKFIKMFKSVITFFYYYERILSEVKSKIDDEIDFLINEDDESEENKQQMDSFVIRLKRNNEQLSKIEEQFKNHERNLIKEFKINPEEFESNFDRVYEEIYCERCDMKIDARLAINTKDLYKIREFEPGIKIFNHELKNDLNYRKVIKFTTSQKKKINNLEKEFDKLSKKFSLNDKSYKFF